MDSSGRAIQLTGKKHLALLAYLAVTSPQRHTREKLAGLLWGSHAESNARQSLRQALAELRAVLPAGTIVSVDTWLALPEAALSCDVAEFDRLAKDGSPAALSKAVSLYRGPLLADLTIAEEDWSEWVEAERRRLQDLAVDIFVRDATNHLEAGHFGEAISVARRAITMDEFREDAHRVLISAAAAAGRRADAVRFYNNLRDLLDRELGIEPEESTTKLVDALQSAGEAAPPLRAEAVSNRSTLAQIGDGLRAVLAVAPPGHASSTSTDIAQGGAGQALSRAKDEKARLIERRGETLLFDCPDVQSAVRLGQAIQSQGYRMGIHAGALRGQAKDTATGIASAAASGQLLATGDVCDVIVDGLDATLEDLGERAVGRADAPSRLFQISPPLTEPARRRSSHLLPAIAVLPLQASGGDQLAAVSGRYIADEIHASLCKTHELAVISRLSTSGFSGLRHGIDDFSQRVGADYVLWGECRILGGELVVDLELCEAHSQKALWQERFATRAELVAKEQTEFVENVIALIRGAILQNEVERSQTEPLGTLENYSLLAAAISLMHRTSRESLSRAGEFLDILTGRLPHHPIPFAWQAQMRLFRITLGLCTNYVEEERLALNHATKAIDLDPTCSIALSTEAWVNLHLRKRFDIASERLDLALEANNSEARAWLLKGTMHAFRGEGAPAVSAAKRALRLSPLDPRRSYFDSLAATAYLADGQYERAIELAKRSLRLNRQHASTLRVLVISHVLCGQVGEAQRWLNDLLRVQPDLTVSSYLDRHPATEFETGRTWASALRKAGLPE
ncbi:MAG TPA: BTAD domain-containing putative transcriptional regulator [Hyphomicrobiaceae bacterium]|nr:BTAD domain-containing putative transcriptional regulator [Hyphomicrobiaceae bacterium]